MSGIGARFVGVELYFDDLTKAKNFYTKTLRLALTEYSPRHHAKFDAGAGFICLEKKASKTIHRGTKLFCFLKFAISKPQSRRLARIALCTRSAAGPFCTIPKATTFCCCRSPLESSAASSRIDFPEHCTSMSGTCA